MKTTLLILTSFVLIILFGSLTYAVVQEEVLFSISPKSTDNPERILQN